MGHKISKEMIDPGVKDHIMSFVGDVANLETEVNTDIISAVNSLMVDRIDNAENMGKIAEAIGEPVTANHTVDEVVDGLGEMLSTFKTNMMNSGVMVESSDRFKNLIDKIKGLTEGEGNKGIQYISGNVSVESDIKNFNEPYGNTSSRYVKIPKPPFEPNVLMVMGTATDSSTDAPFTPTSILSYDPAFEKSMVKIGSFGNGESSQLYYDHVIADSLVVGSDCYYIPISYAYSQTGYDWFAFGVGEEDTTLRDSLADILENKGVDVTEEDDMASLITKVDGISGGLDIISATELPATGRENQICVITNNNIDEYSIIPRYENNVNGKIILISCDDTSLPLISTTGRVSYEFYFSDVIYNNEYLGSYYYSNGWNQLTQPKQYLYKYGTWVNKTIMGTISPDGSVLVDLGDGLKIVKGSHSFAYCYFSGSTSLAEYNTIEIWATNNTSKDIALSIEGRSGDGPSEGTPSNGSADGWTSSVYESGSATLKTGFNKCLIDISNFTDTCVNALICRNLDGSYSSANVTIHAILIY